MLQLNSDEAFHYELLRNLSHARYFGSDISEILEAAAKIEPGNFESFYEVFNGLALRVNGQADRIDSLTYPVSARDAYFRAATYYRAADFYLHGKPEDPRLNCLWEKHASVFNKAIGLLDVPGELLTLKADGFNVPAIFYRPSKDRSEPKPTLILGNGYDGAQEEMLHVCGFAALERGFNVITYEGPGQPTVRRYQDLGFITEWEKVVSPVVDYLVAQPDVDASKISLWGYSMGGWLALRAAAFEHRLAAIMAVDGIFSVHQAYLAALPPQAKSAWDLDDSKPIDDAITSLLASGKAPTGLRWGIEQGMWSFNAKSPSEFLKKTEKMTLEGTSDQIACPIWLGDATEDSFFKGQPEVAKAALGDRAIHVALTAEDGAATHCHVGATSFLNQLVFDWLEQTVSKIKYNIT